MSKDAETQLEDVGLIAGVFGIKGWVKIVSYTEPDENIFEYAPWQLRMPKALREIEVEQYKRHKGGWIAKLKGVDDRNEAELLARVKIAIDENNFSELEDGDFYWRDLIGLRVIGIAADSAAENVDFGVVNSLMETGANDVLVVSADANSVDDRERLIPYVPELYVDSVDLEQGKIYVLWDAEY